MSDCFVHPAHDGEVEVTIVVEETGEEVSETICEDCLDLSRRAVQYA